MDESTLTSKRQATVPKRIADFLGAKPGQMIEWYIVGGKVLVDAPKRIKNPTKFLTTQNVRLNIDMVNLIKNVRANL
ncbi:MAG: AbrB/MazE/SpoVT family DNA-binding domain-containing protein [Candidatus Diapherotrites archaeon]